MADNEAVIDVFARALQAVEQSKQSEMTLSNGIVLGLRTVGAGLLRRVVTAIPMPPVPMVYIEAKGRDEENPLDPAYLAAVQKCHSDRLEADMRARRTLGTYVKMVPEGMYGPDDDGWVDAVRVAGIEPDLSNQHIRYSEWLDCYAISSPIDQVTLSAACFAASGIFDAEVQTAIDYFRSRTERRADTELPIAPAPGDGDTVPGEPAGAGASG